MWDVAIVGAGPAGSAAALGALQADPSAKVLLLDRASFPRDKSCGDGIAPHAFDVLADVGVTGLVDDWAPLSQLAVHAGRSSVSRSMRRPAYVVPRSVFDARLVDAAVSAGAVLQRHRVRTLRRQPDAVLLDNAVRAKVVVGADGAASVVRAALGARPAAQRALALRGYAPTPRQLAGKQTIVFGAGRQPAYAWSFDRGDGLSNVGYGELLTARRPQPTRRSLLEQLERLLPGSAQGGGDWLGHHLPLSSWRWRHPCGPVLLAGDAAGLVNPMTGEGIYYAVATGVAAGRAAVGGVRAGEPDSSGESYRGTVRRLLARHLRSTAVGSRLLSVPAVAGAAVRAAEADQRVFDDLVEVGLGRGTLTPATVAACIKQFRHTLDTCEVPAR